MEDFSKWKLQHLKQELIALSLSPKGKKSELQLRLQEALKNRKGSTSINSPSFEKWTATHIKNEAKRRNLSCTNLTEMIQALKMSDSNEKENDKSLSNEKVSPNKSSSISPQEGSTNSLVCSETLTPKKKLSFSPPKSGSPPKQEWRVKEGKQSMSPSTPTSPKTPPTSPTSTSPSSSRPRSPSSPNTLQKSISDSITLQSRRTSPGSPDTLSFRRHSMPAHVSPRSILKSPKKPPKAPMTPTKVVWKEVEVRRYHRLHAGGGGVPSEGGYPLGLDWEYDPESSEKQPLAVYEKQKEKKNSDDLRRVPEHVRKELLESCPSPTVIRKEDIKQLKSELVHIRRSRTKNGCVCKGTSGKCCATNKCICFRNELECHEDSCGCTEELCRNPRRHQFDETKVDKWRQRRLRELNREIITDSNVTVSSN